MAEPDLAVLELTDHVVSGEGHNPYVALRGNPVSQRSQRRGGIQGLFVLCNSSLDRGSRSRRRVCRLRYPSSARLPHQPNCFQERLQDRGLVIAPIDTVHVDGNRWRFVQAFEDHARQAQLRNGCGDQRNSESGGDQGYRG